MNRKKTELLRECIKQYSLRELLEEKLAEIVEMVKEVEANHNLYYEVIRQTESVLLKLILSETNTQTEAAQILGINRNTLRKKIRELNIN